ncbi:MAG: MFS transporter, partial [Candidatus Eremiobacteraeota bacterium]|nr:MFS transporter [Candidatus Eremiobacteraeota bacterium]
MSDSRGYPVARSALLNAFWIPLNFQDTALITIAVPAAVLQLQPQHHVRVFAALAAMVSFIAMFVPPIAGAISDRLRQRGVPRRAFILGGAALDVACLVLMAQSRTLPLFTTFLLLATVGANVSLAAYQALLPDIVPKTAWGAVSGARSIAMVLGTALGIGVAAGTPPASAFIGVACAAGLGALTILFVHETPANGETETEKAHVKDWHDFIVVFIARMFLAFGLALLMTFVLYFFKDVLHAANPSANTGIVAGASLVGAIVSAAYLGWLSDRVSRKYLVALCGIPMVLAAAGFGAVPQERWMFGFAFLFGVGFGGVLSTGWALAIDSVPRLRDVARDLGIWGIATNLPSVIAPLVGAWILGIYGGSLTGYRVLFFSAAFSFLLASATVLDVGSRPFIPLWAIVPRILSAWVVAAYTHTTYRIRRWGKLPVPRGRTLVVSNHQNELDLMPAFANFILGGGWRTPVLSASAKVLFEPGFLAVRIPWLWRVLHNVNMGG